METLETYPQIAKGERVSACRSCGGDGRQVGRGLCTTCYQRLYARGRERRTLRRCRPKGSIQETQQGYLMVAAPGHPNAEASGRIRVHRLVMSQMLGRPLWQGEQPHHKNGNRSDNRPENLELWAKRQPPGQRVDDLIEYATEILRDYAPERLA